MSARRLPPHTTTEPDGVLTFTMSEGGIVEKTRPGILRCKRCEVESEPVRDLGVLGEFMRAHAGPACGAMTKATKKSRRAA